MADGLASARLSGLERGEVHVWRLRLGATAAGLASLRDLLDDAERQRADRFVFGVHRDRYVVAHGLLRRLISRYTGGSAASIAFVGGARAKPRLSGRSSLRFSLSHSGDLGLVALAWHREVGVDVEAVRPLADLDGLAATCLSPSERAELEALPEARRQRAFFEGWTRKEAFLKAIGDGLSRPLPGVDVTLRPGEPARLLRVEWDPGLCSRYALWALDPGDGFAGALATEGTDVTVRQCGDVGVGDATGESDGARGDRGGDRFSGIGEPRGPVLDLAGGQAAAPGLAACGHAGKQAGVPRVDRAGLDGHDAGKPAAEVRAAL